MANTTIATNNALARKLYSSSLFTDILKEAYFTKFFGGDPNSIVHMKSKLDKEKGDRETFGIRMRLTGNGVTEGQALLGNEESLDTYSFNVTLGEVAHAVVSAGPMSEKRAAFDLTAEMEQALQDWGSEKVDADCFSAMFAGTSTKEFFGGTAVATSGLSAGDKITPALISKAKAYALGGGSRNIVPLRPVKVEGGQYFVLLMHPDQAYDLFTDTTWGDRVKDAAARGPQHPFFTGALGIYDNVILHVNEQVPLYTTWGTGAIAGASAMFMGAQSLCFAWGRKPILVNEKQDYQRKNGFGLSMIYGVAKPTFNSKDFGSIRISTARTAIN